jgi:hypothetical protein
MFIMVEALGCEINEEQMYFVDENRQVGGMDWLVSRIYGSGLRKVYLETTGVLRTHSKCLQDNHKNT